MADRRSPSLVVRLGVLAALLAGVVAARAADRRRTLVPSGVRPGRSRLRRSRGWRCTCGRAARSGARWSSLVARAGRRRAGDTTGRTRSSGIPSTSACCSWRRARYWRIRRWPRCAWPSGLAAGMARKIPAEERVLRAACGEAWRALCRDGADADAPAVRACSGARGGDDGAQRVRIVRAGCRAARRRPAGRSRRCTCGAADPAARPTCPARRRRRASRR